jgi:hypothetical protein
VWEISEGDTKIMNTMKLVPLEDLVSKAQTIFANAFPRFWWVTMLLWHFTSPKEVVVATTPSRMILIVVTPRFKAPSNSTH